MNCWGKRSDQIAKGEFLEVPLNSQRRNALCQVLVAAARVVAAAVLAAPEDTEVARVVLAAPEDTEVPAAPVVLVGIGPLLPTDRPWVASGATAGGIPIPGAGPTAAADACFP